MGYAARPSSSHLVPPLPAHPPQRLHSSLPLLGPSSHSWTFWTRAAAPASPPSLNPLTRILGEERRGWRVSDGRWSRVSAASHPGAGSLTSPRPACQSPAGALLLAAFSASDCVCHSRRRPHSHRRPAPCSARTRPPRRHRLSPRGERSLAPRRSAHDQRLPEALTPQVSSPAPERNFEGVEWGRGEGWPGDESLKPEKWGHAWLHIPPPPYTDTQLPSPKPLSQGSLWPSGPAGLRDLRKFAFSTADSDSAAQFRRTPNPVGRSPGGTRQG